MVIFWYTERIDSVHVHKHKCLMHKEKTMAYHITPTTLGEYTTTEVCPCCDGSGMQREVVYMAGYLEHEHDVPCYICESQGVVVTLVCGRCGEEAHALSGEYVSDHRICSCCGHEAPNYLWLPMEERKTSLLESA